MKISYNWLEQYINLELSSDEVADKLTLLGLEVEEIEEIGSDFENFVVGYVKEVNAHPNADKLVLCQVDTGEETVQIACGAKNVASGQKVPVAKVGATIPVPMKDGSYLTIKKAKLRGEVSNGMICSEAELGLSDDHSGIMVMDEQHETGTPLKKALDVEKDSVFEIALTPNRPDAASHIGVARDLSAVTEAGLQNPYDKITESAGDENERIQISIEDQAACHRYVGILVDNVTVGESPNWLKNRLTSIGLRPINNVVDVTNFVLHESGQPLHAFDYKLISDKKIVVKHFEDEQTFTTLDSIDRKVPAGSLFICDGNGPVAIAGVMGGENSEVNKDTETILIESAWFEPSSIRKTSKKLALQTDSSYRFERGIDPHLQLKAAIRAASLISEVSGGKIDPNYVDVHPVKHSPIKIDLRVSRVNHLLGTDLDEKLVSTILQKLDFKVSSSDEGVLTCMVPSFRPDIEREVDLIEEVGRVYDYNNIPRPDSSPFISPANLTEEEVFVERMRSLAKSLKYKEISTNSLLSGHEADLLGDREIQIKTLNPVSQENTTLRTHLAGGFLKSVRYNLNRKAKTLRFFEIGHVFRHSDQSTWIEGVQEHTHLLLGLCGIKKEEDWQGGREYFTIFDLKSDLHSIFSDLSIYNDLEEEVADNYQVNYLYNKECVATLRRFENDILKGFDVEQEVYAAEVDLTALLSAGVGGQKTYFEAIPKYPSFEFDVAFTVDKNVRAGQMHNLIREAAGSILKNVSTFDVYEGENLGEGKKSIAFRLTFLDSNKTLTIKDVEPVVQIIVQKLEKTLGAKLRS